MIIAVTILGASSAIALEILGASSAIAVAKIALEILGASSVIAVAKIAIAILSESSAIALEILRASSANAVAKIAMAILRASSVIAVAKIAIAILSASSVIAVAKIAMEILGASSAITVAYETMTNENSHCNTWCEQRNSRCENSLGDPRCEYCDRRRERDHDNDPPCDQRNRCREQPPSEWCKWLAVSSELMVHQLQRVWRPLNEMCVHKDGVGLLLKTSHSLVGMEEK